MSLTLERLIYVSRAAPDGESLLGVAEILGQARHRNLQRGLSGVLAVRNGRFIGVMEGSPSTLDALLAALQADDRHGDLVVVDRRVVVARQFGRHPLAGPIISPDLDQVISDLATDADMAVTLLADLIPSSI